MEMLNQPTAEVVKDYHSELVQKMFFTFIDT